MRTQLSTLFSVFLYVCMSLAISLHFPPFSLYLSLCLSLSISSYNLSMLTSPCSFILIGLRFFCRPFILSLSPISHSYLSLPVHPSHAFLFAIIFFPTLPYNPLLQVSLTLFQHFVEVF